MDNINKNQVHTGQQQMIGVNQIITDAQRTLYAQKQSPTKLE